MRATNRKEESPGERNERHRRKTNTLLARALHNVHLAHQLSSPKSDRGEPAKKKERLLLHQGSQFTEDDRSNYLTLTTAARPRDRTANQPEHFPSLSTPPPPLPCTWYILCMSVYYTSSLLPKATSAQGKSLEHVG